MEKNNNFVLLYPRQEQTRNRICDFVKLMRVIFLSQEQLGRRHVVFCCLGYLAFQIGIGLGL